MIPGALLLLPLITFAPRYQISGDESLKLEYRAGSGPLISNAREDFIIEDFRVGNEPVVWPLDATIETISPSGGRNATGTTASATVVDEKGRTFQFEITAQGHQVLFEISGLPASAPVQLKARIRSKRDTIRMQSSVTTPFTPGVIQMAMGDPDFRSDIIYDRMADLAIFAEPRGLGFVTKAEKSKEDGDGSSRWVVWNAKSSASGGCNGNVISVIYRSLGTQLKIKGDSPPAVTRLDRAPSGWRSGFAYPKLCSAAALEAEALILQKTLVPFGLKYFIIDDGWQTATHKDRAARTWEADAARFPGGLAPVAQKLKQLGFAPGIWWIPQAAPDDIDDKSGVLQYSDGRPIDGDIQGDLLYHPTSPAAGEAIVKRAGRFAKEGFEYLYFDAQAEYVAALHFAEQETPKSLDAGKDYRKLMRAVAAETGPGVVLSNGWAGAKHPGAPVSPLDGMGVFDIYTTGLTTGSHAAGLENALSNIAKLPWVNGILTHEDPGPVRVGGDLSIDEARAWASALALSGQSIFLAEQMSAIQPERLEILKRVLPTMPLHQCYAPVELNNIRVMQLWNARGDETALVLGYFNAGQRDAEIASWYIDDYSQKYLNGCELFEFWSGRFIGRAHYLQTPALYVDFGSCAVLSARAARPHPFVLSTSRHVAQGAIDLTKEMFDESTLTLSGTSLAVAGDVYELRVVVPGREWSAREFDAGSIKGKIIQMGRIARIAFTPPASGPVEWKLQFEKRPVDVNVKPAAQRYEIESLTGRPVRDPGVRLTWDARNSPSGMFLVKRDGFTLGSTFVPAFRDRSRDIQYNKTYEYEVVPVDEDGVEGKPVKITVNTAQPHRILLKELQRTPRRAASPVINDGKSVLGGPLVMQGKLYEDGIGVAPPTVLDFNLRGASGAFTATIGLDDSAKTGGTAIVKFYVDNRPIGETGLLRGGAKPQDIRVRIPRGEKFTIEINDNADGWDFDFVNIADPVITASGRIERRDK